MRLLESLLGRTRLPPDAAVVELGCASGRFAGRLARRGLRVCGIEGHAEALAQAQDTPGLELIHGDVCRPPLAPAQFDLVVALDVLEHVPAEPFLAETARLGRRDARLLLSVPAGPRLWSRMDELAGHRCRYTLRQLRAELGASGWRVRHATHYQFLLFPLLMMSRGLARRRELPVEQRPPSPLNALLWAVNLAEVTLLSRFRLPFGSSIVTVAERAS
jgi:SAM-dependent methyltransferase